MHRTRRLRGRLVGIGARLFLAMLLFGRAEVRAQASYTYNASVLRIDPHARTAALGGSFTAMTADYNLLRYNPAGLSVLAQPLLSASYHSWIGGTSQNHYELAFPVPRGGLGMSISYLSAGSIEEVDARFEKTGIRLHSNDLLFMTGGARARRLRGGTLAVGLGFRYLYQNLAGISGKSLGLDVGSLYAHGPLTAGLVVQNLSLRPARFVRTLAYLPRTLRTGVTYHVNRRNPVSWLLAADLVQPHPEARINWHMGAELHVGGMMMVRSGYHHRPGGPTGRWQAGMGFDVPLSMFSNDARVTFDYAYTLLQNGWGPIHYLSIALRPGHQHSNPFSEAQSGVLMPYAPEAAPPSMVTDTLAVEKTPVPRSDPRVLAAPALLPPAPPVDKPAPASLAWPPDRARPPSAPVGMAASRVPRVADVHRLPPRPLSNEPILIRAHIHFDYGQATIPPSEHDKLARLADQLAAMPNRPIWVSGHTDYEGTVAWNMDLSQHRIDSVLTFLETRHAIPPARFVKPTPYGETRPIADNTTAAGRALNRRVEFILLPPETDRDAFVPEGSVVEGVHALSERTVAIFRNGRSAYELIRQNNGRRLVLDFPGLARMNSAQPVPPVQRRLIRQVRTEATETPRRTRVIIDLTRPAPYCVDDRGRVLMLHVEDERQPDQ